MELTLQELTKCYRDKEALKNISLTLTPGIWGLLGPNGAGKTTMMNMIAGILPATRGAVLWNGQPIEKLGAEYRSIIGFLPQAAGLYDNFTARMYLRYMCALKGLYQKRSEKALLEEHIEQTLASVNLVEDANRQIRAFSGGMRQRLGVAQALLGDPKLVILDEPTAGLDPQERARLRNAVASISGDRIVLWSTHIVSDVENIARRVILLQKGDCIAVGTPLELIGEMEGKVWNITVSAAELPSYKDRYTLSNIVAVEDNFQIRLVAAEPPCPEAQPAKPCLEDLYLLRFGGDAG